MGTCDPHALFRKKWLAVLLLSSGVTCSRNNADKGSMHATTNTSMNDTSSFGAHVCNNGIHYYVEHAKSCNVYSNSDQEKLGCHLMEYQRQKRFSNLRQDRQVHWYGGAPEQNMFEFQGGRVGETCAYYDEDYTEATGSVGHEFRMPDYCSRAMISELSTVYDGKTRHATLLAGAKVLFDAVSWNYCSWQRTFMNYAEIFSKERKSKACWNMADDWKKLYCLKYRECKCPENPNDGNCYFNNTAIQCCKRLHEEWLNSEYGPSPELTNGYGRASSITGSRFY